MTTQVWIDADTRQVFKSEMVAWKRYMDLNERRKPCIIVIQRPDGSYECFSKLFLKSAICYSDKEVTQLVGSFL